MSTQLILALETSSRHGSVALGRGGDLLASRDLTAERRHAAELMPAIQDLLREADAGPGDVGCVAFSQGPGSFTGLRVAATIARMWQLSSGCDVVAVPSLEVLASNALAAGEVAGEAPAAGSGEAPASASRETAADMPVETPAGERGNVPQRVAAILDARQGKVFAAVYRINADGMPGEVEPPALAAVAAWLERVERPCVALGDGVARHHDAVEQAGLTILPEALWWPRAEHVLRLGSVRAENGEFCTPEQIVPNYMRPPECEEVYEKRRAEARARRGE